MLTQEERQKIEEEEKLRSELREKSKPKKKTSLLTWLVLILFVSIAVVMAIPKSPSSTSQTPQPKARDLEGHIISDNQTLTIYNDEKVKWESCAIRLNVYWKASVNLNPGKNSVSWDDFVKDGSERFNWYATKPTSVNVQCKEPYGAMQGIF